MPFDAVKLTLLEAGGSGEPHQSDDLSFEVKAVFNALAGSFQLEQTVGDLKTPSFAKRAIKVRFTPRNSTLVNGEGLADRSLLTTFKLNATLTSKVEASSDQECRADLADVLQTTRLIKPSRFAGVPSERCSFASGRSC